jgi:hypothetical protein
MPQAAQTAVVLNFDEPWITIGGNEYSGYDQGGMTFRVTTPPLAPEPIFYIARLGSFITGGVPYNNTPRLAWNNNTSFQQEFVVFSLTNGDTFGLLSVDLADRYVRSEPVSITFKGYRPDNSMVTATFATPGGFTEFFQNYAFPPEFANGLSRVEIPSRAWSMDNLIINPIPEPGTLALFGSGLLLLGAWAARKRRQVHASN